MIICTALEKGEHYVSLELKNEHTTWVDIMISASQEQFKKRMKEIEKKFRLKNMRNAIKVHFVLQL